MAGRLSSAGDIRKLLIDNALQRVKRKILNHQRERQVLA